MSTLVLGRPPFPPFSPETAATKVRMAEDAWNARDAQRVAQACTADSRWCQGDEHPTGRAQIVQFLQRQWSLQRDGRVMKELWLGGGNRLAVRFVCEFHDGDRRWFRCLGSELCGFDAQGLMAWRWASAHCQPIAAAQRQFHWRLGRRPDDHPGLGALDLWASPAPTLFDRPSTE